MSHEQVMMRHFDVVINATPDRHVAATERDAVRGQIPGEIVFDMVYNPA